MVFRFHTVKTSRAFSARSAIEKGFWIKCNPFIQHFLLGNDIGGVTGHE
jgi:hypothetical protein